MDGDHGSCKKKDNPVFLIVSESLILVDKLIKELNTPGLIIVVILKSQFKPAKDFKSNGKVILLKNIREVVNSFRYITYLIYLRGYEKNLFESNRKFLGCLKSDTREINYLINHYKCKTTFAFYGVRGNSMKANHLKKYETYIDKLKASCAVVVYGDLVSLSGSDFLLSDLQTNLTKAALNEKVRIIKERIYYPLLDSEFVDNILRVLYSLKTYGKTTFIAGRPLKPDTLVDVIGNDKRLSLKDKQFALLPYDDKIISKKQSKVIVSKVNKYLVENKRVRDIDAENAGHNFNRQSFLIGKKLNNFIGIFSIQKIRNFFINKKKKVLILAVASTFILPILLIIFSLFFQYLAVYYFKRDLLKPALISAKTSFFFTRNSQLYNSVLSKTPFVNRYFKLFTEPVAVLYIQSELISKKLETIDVFANVVRNIVFKEDSDTDDNLRKIVFNLEDIYEKLGFLESEIAGQDDLASRYIKFFYKDESPASIREKTVKLRNLIDSIDSVTTRGKKNTLALIFQNSSKLRPTGGNIEAISVINLDGLGSTEKIVVEDVSWIDEKNYAIVEPPFTLKEYFGIDNWYFKESNWDPDFQFAAERMKMLLNKNLNMSFDSLLLIDSNFILEFLEMLNGKKHEEYLSDTLFEITNQTNYPQDFEENQTVRILRKLTEGNYVVDDKSIIKILRHVYQGFNNRDIQMFSEYEDIQESIADLNWDGSFRNNSSSKTCSYDFISLIESTYEGNSREVTREAQMFVNFQEGLIKRKLVLYVDNRNDSDYKAYFRLFGNEEVGFSPVIFIEAEKERVLTSQVSSAKELKEEGVFVQVKPKDTVGIIFEWEGVSCDGFNKSGEYTLFWRKQAGVDAYPVEISFNFPKDVVVFSNTDSSLTEEGVFIYNTLLDRDLSPNIFW